MEIQADDDIIRDALMTWILQEINLAKAALFITVTFRDYASIRRVNKVAKAICDKVTPTGLVYVFAEQGERYGKVHAHALLLVNYDWDVSMTMALQSFLNVEFGRSEVENCREGARRYVTKYATKECANDQWGVWQIGDYTGELITGWGHRKERYEAASLAESQSSDPLYLRDVPDGKIGTGSVSRAVADDSR